MGFLPRTSRATKPVGLSIQHRVQRLLDRSTNHLIKMIPDPRLIIWITIDHREGPNLAALRDFVLELLPRGIPP